ncbi:MAG: tripartite tricarboxylate transporter substrate-binding protein, partial [Ramlibacter sp.]
MHTSIGRKMLLAPLLALCFSAAWAQAYPNKPVRLIVPFAPGGFTDVVARILGQKLSASMGQQWVIENKAGAGSTIGTDFVAKAAPDGYTLVMVSTTHV